MALDLIIKNGIVVDGSGLPRYRAARKINRDPGVVKRLLQLFDALAVLDTHGALAGVRAAAAGEA